jgi:hypothetical protein
VNKFAPGLQFVLPERKSQLVEIVVARLDDGLASGANFVDDGV